jgi:hypothetical protein
LALALALAFLAFTDEQAETEGDNDERGCDVRAARTLEKKCSHLPDRHKRKYQDNDDDERSVKY